MGASGREKWWWFLLGGAVSSSVLLAFAFAKRKRKLRGCGKPPLFPPPSSSLQSPLHHLDLSRLRDSPQKATVTSSSDSLDAEKSMVFQIVLTGGPCGGKSSTMLHLDKVLREDHGFDVYLCPEVPTLLLNAGCRYPGYFGDERELVQFEVSLVELQLQMELSMVQIAQSTGRPSVILYDRGLLDFAAYTPQEKWAQVMNHNQWICDGILHCATKYDLILHLETAARGAEHAFSRGGVAATSKQEVDDARELDRKLLACWRGHPHQRMIDNSTDFSGKLARATRHVLELVLNHRLLL